MILPIIGLGHPVLREKTQEITPEYPNLGALIDNMFETMYNAQGVGLAAPQIGLAIRLFVVDGSPMEPGDEEDDLTDFKRVIINPVKVEEHGAPWPYEEGCLSIPDVRESVKRPEFITIRYQNQNFEEVTETLSGMKARIVQHEYDHLEGTLFTDYISPMRRQVIRTRLAKISKGEVAAPYPMKYGKQK
ncbi:MAG: peptide deformylase [Bacteroidia bacterium]|nr:peptide deformylase [Bacteroidia bacterium]